MTTSKCPLCNSEESRDLYHRTFRQCDWSLNRCTSCGLHFTLPIPTVDDLTSFYQGEYHQVLREHGGTEKAFKAKYERYADTLGRYLKSGRVVDVGCSTGLLVRILCDRGYEAEGIELNASSAEWGRHNYGVKIDEKPLEQSSHKPESLDGILMTDVLEHTLHPRDYLAEVGKLLKPGGTMLITFPDIRSLESQIFYMYSKLLKRDWIWHTCHIPLHVWEFTRKTATQTFESAGFRVRHFQRIQPPPDENSNGLMIKLLHFPVQLIRLPLLSHFFGTQMEFVISKESI